MRYVGHVLLPKLRGKDYGEKLMAKKCIDAETTMKEMGRMLSECFPDEDEIKDACITTLMEMPAADVVEVKRGKWFHYEGMCTCDQCNSTLDDISPFCPMCGADMREGKKDEID